jgi:hypothetical protein
MDAVEKENEKMQKVEKIIAATEELDSSVIESDQYMDFNFENAHENFSQIIECISVPPNSLLTNDVKVRILKF